MHSHYGFKRVSDQLQSEISTYMQQHEPPLEHQLLRILMSLSSEISSFDGFFDVNKVKFLTSSDPKKSSFIISLPCKSVSQNLIDMIKQIMAKFQYKFLNQTYHSDIKELHFYFSI